MTFTSFVSMASSCGNDQEIFYLIIGSSVGFISRCNTSVTSALMEHNIQHHNYICLICIYM